MYISRCMDGRQRQRKAFSLTRRRAPDRREEMHAKVKRVPQNSESRNSEEKSNRKESSSLGGDQKKKRMVVLETVSLKRSRGRANTAATARGRERDRKREGVCYTHTHVHTHTTNTRARTEECDFLFSSVLCHRFSVARHQWQRPKRYRAHVFEYPLLYLCTLPRCRCCRRGLAFNASIPLPLLPTSFTPSCVPHSSSTEKSLKECCQKRKRAREPISLPRLSPFTSGKHHNSAAHTPFEKRKKGKQTTEKLRDVADLPPTTKLHTYVHTTREQKKERDS